MDFYPFNLVLAVATAATTVFLGFLPTRNIRTDFFARQVFPVVFAWVLIAFISPVTVRHFHFLIAFLSFASWWQFHRENGLGGKMWLSVASGLGISLGVMLILAVTPRAFPAGMTQLGQGLLLASIYLGGAVIGLAYVCSALIQGLTPSSGVTRDQVQHYVQLLVGLVVARAAVLLALVFMTRPLAVKFLGAYLHDTYYRVPAPNARMEIYLLLILVVLILPILAFVARRAVRAQAFNRALPALIGLCFGAVCAEIFSRLLLL